MRKSFIRTRGYNLSNRFLTRGLGAGRKFRQWREMIVQATWGVVPRIIGDAIKRRGADE